MKSNKTNSLFTSLTAEEASNINGACYYYWNPCRSTCWSSGGSWGGGSWGGGSGGWSGGSSSSVNQTVNVNVLVED